MIKLTDYNNQPNNDLNQEKKQVEQQIRQLATKLEIDKKIINRKLVELTRPTEISALNQAKISLFTFCWNTWLENLNYSQWYWVRTGLLIETLKPVNSQILQFKFKNTLANLKLFTLALEEKNNLFAQALVEVYWERQEKIESLVSEGELRLELETTSLLELKEKLVKVEQELNELKIKEGELENSSLIETNYQFQNLKQTTEENQQQLIKYDNLANVINNCAGKIQKEEILQQQIELLKNSLAKSELDLKYHHYLFTLFAKKGQELERKNNHLKKIIIDKEQKEVKREEILKEFFDYFKTSKRDYQTKEQEQAERTRQSEQTTRQEKVAFEQEIDRLGGIISSKERQINYYQIEKAELQERVKQAEEEWILDENSSTIIEAQNNQIRNQTEEIKELNKQLTEERNKTRITEIIETTGTTDNKDAIIRTLENSLNDRNTEIRQLKSEQENLQPSSISVNNKYLFIFNIALSACFLGYFVPIKKILGHFTAKTRHRSKYERKE